MERLDHCGQLAHIGRYSLYVLPSGDLIVISGTVKLQVTPQEARELLDYLLIFAERFHTAGIPASNGHQESVLSHE
jgi:hypothetical protein